jgi:hypothetical protein
MLLQVGFWLSEQRIGCVWFRLNRDSYRVSFNSDGGGRLVSNLVVVVTGYCSGGVGWWWWCGVWISSDSVVTDLGYDCVLTRRVCRCVC